MAAVYAPPCEGAHDHLREDGGGRAARRPDLGARGRVQVSHGDAERVSTVYSERLEILFVAMKNPL